MTELTLKKFREITKDMPEDTTMNTTIEFGKEWSIRGTIDCIHLCPEEHSYSRENHVTLTQSKKGNFVVKRLTGLNKWETLEDSNDNSKKTV